MSMSLDCEKKPEELEKTQKDPGQLVDSNPKSSCCEALVLTITPLCHSEFILPHLIYFLVVQKGEFSN